tara:strand:- start:3 stop:1478 length:1476 start_codon:yes stop_codon:yes gene_type:complete
MTNLSELLPAGGGGKQAEFVASGVIPNGTAVALNSNGTISVVDPDGYPPTAGTASVFEAANTSALSFCYDSTNNKVFAAYIDGGTNYFTAVLGTVSGKTITFATPVVLNSNTAQTGSPGSGCAYNPSANRVLVVYQWRDGSNNKFLVARGCSTSGSLSLGSEGNVANYADVTMSDICVSYDAQASRNMIAYYWGYPYYTGYIESCQINGTLLSFGSNYQIDSQGIANYPNSLVYDSGNNRTILGYQRSGNIYFIAINASANGAQSHSGEYNPSINSYAAPTAYDTNQQKIVVAYGDSISQAGKVLVINYNGSAFSKGSVTTIATNTLCYFDSNGVSFDSQTNKIGIVYRNGDNGYPYPGKLITGTVSGTTITLSPTATTIGSKFQNPRNVYNSTEKVFVIAYIDVNNNNYGTALAIDSGQSNNIDYVGISDASISDTATGSITLRGGVSTNLSSLTPNSTYYVQTDGTITTTVSDAIAGKALSSTSLLLKG